MGYRIAYPALIADAAFIVIFSIWTPLLHPEIAARWFTPANMVMLSPVPLATAAAVGALWLALNRRQRYTPFLLGAALFMLCYTGLAVSLFPYIVPPGITIWQAAAAAPDSQPLCLWRDPAAADHPRLHRVFLLRAMARARARRLPLRSKNRTTTCRAGRARRCGASRA